jgi:hypothetical protein
MASVGLASIVTQIIEVAIKAIDEGNWKTINVTKNNNLQNAILELGNGIISK